MVCRRQLHRKYRNQRAHLKRRSSSTKNCNDWLLSKEIEAGVQQDQTGTDPRAFNNKWMPFFRSQELENGLKQYDLTAFGTVGFSPRVGMFYEVPVAQYRDFTDISGFPPGLDGTVIGIGDTSLKFLVNLEALEFTFGNEGEKSGSVLLGMDYVLPTATDDALGGDAFLFAPIVGVVIDMPFYGFFAALNLYYTDVYKKDPKLRFETTQQRYTT